LIIFSKRKKKSQNITFKCSFKQCRSLKFLNKDNKLILLFSYVQKRRKPQFFKALLILMKVLPTEARTYVVFCDYFKIFFGSTDLKYSWFKHKLKLFVFKCTIIVVTDFLLYISYKTTFFKNIIPKSTLVRFWWFFYQQKQY
jgi:hypothetical protein